MTIGHKKQLRKISLKSKYNPKIKDINKGSDSRIKAGAGKHLNTGRPKTKKLTKSKIRRGRLGEKVGGIR